LQKKPERGRGKRSLVTFKEEPRGQKREELSRDKEFALPVKARGRFERRLLDFKGEGQGSRLGVMYNFKGEHSNGGRIGVKRPCGSSDIMLHAKAGKQKDTSGGGVSGGNAHAHRG